MFCFGQSYENDGGCEHEKCGAGCEDEAGASCSEQQRDHDGAQQGAEAACGRGCSDADAAGAGGEQFGRVGEDGGPHPEEEELEDRAVQGNGTPREAGGAGCDCQFGMAAFSQFGLAVLADS